MKRLRHIHHKTAKGRAYVYFDTGQHDPAGKKIFTRMPDERDPAFPRAYSTACDQRNNRKQRLQSLTFEGLFRRFEKSPEFKRLADNSKLSYSRYLTVASGLLRDSEGRSIEVELIEPSDIITIRDTLADGRGANQTIRCISALYHWACKPTRRLVPSNPATDVELFDEGEHEPWPAWLVEEALQDSRVRAAVGLFYFTGQRIGDVVKMQWTDISGGAVIMRQTKTGKDLTIPLHSELAAILAEIPRRGFTILATEVGKRLSENSLRLRLQDWAKARGQSVVPHGLRKNAVNALLEAGCSTAEVGAITGQTLQTIEHYAKKRDQRHLGRGAILKLEGARQKRNMERT